jgi:hypothetical protein
MLEQRSEIGSLQASKLNRALGGSLELAFGRQEHGCFQL